LAAILGAEQKLYVLMVALLIPFGLAQIHKTLAQNNKARRRSPPYLSAAGAGRIALRGRCFGRYMETPAKIVVVVDDDPAIREAMESLLSAVGYRAQLYGSGAEFLAAVDAVDAACLILDIQLGDITGIELARQLISSGFNVPTIFMSGSDDESFRQDGRALGCVDFLRKPFRAQVLMSALSKAINP
jgi:CheY-like chemotaxis protein